jgi:hypothetical protein
MRPDASPRSAGASLSATMVVMAACIAFRATADMIQATMIHASEGV